MWQRLRDIRGLLHEAPTTAMREREGRRVWRVQILGCHKTLRGVVLQLLGDVRQMQVGEGLTDEDTEEQGR